MAIDRPLSGEGVPLLPGAMYSNRDQQRYCQGVAFPQQHYDGNHVLIADEDNLLARRDVEVGWQASGWCC